MSMNAQQATNTLQESLRTWKKERVSGYKAQKYNKDALVMPGPEKDDERLLILEDLCAKEADLKHLEVERGFGCIPHVFWCKKLIQFFLDRGANVNSKDENGDTALHLAIRHFDSRYGVSVQDDQNHTPDNVNSMRNVIKFLLEEASGDPKLTNSRGENVFFTSLKNEGIAQMLIEKGVDVTACNIDGESILHTHCDSDFIDSFQGAVDIRTQNWLYSQTPLITNARETFLEDCQILVQKGAFVNAQDLQGYTALHHAVFEGGTECAEFLVKAGTDTNLKSEYGRDCYDIGISRGKIEQIFVQGATPSKQAEIYEMAGTFVILRNYLDFKGCFEFWDKAMNIYKEFGLKPPKEFSSNHKFLAKNLNNLNKETKLHNLAMKTIDRLSPNAFSRFWNFLASAPEPQDSRAYYFYILKYLLPEFKKVDEFASFEERDIFVLYKFLQFFDEEYLKPLFQFGAAEGEFGEEDEVEEFALWRISLFHCVAKLGIACFDKIKSKTESNKLSYICSDMYVTLCRSLTMVQCGNDMVYDFEIPQEQLDDNKRLLRSLIELDFRDRQGNTLLHLILKNKLEFESEYVLALLKTVKKKVVKTKNDAGFEPFQVIDWKKWNPRNDPTFIKVLRKMAAKGAHVDARPSINYCASDEQQPVIQFSLRFDNLQCACARVLVKSLAPYANRVPKHVVDFINAH